MSLPKVDFDINDRDFHWLERRAFWETQEGYTTYRLEYQWYGEPVSDVSCSSPQYIFEGEVRHPYAFSGGDPEDAKNPPLYVYPNGRVVYAQDREHRHVVIKLVENASEEYKILRFLSKQSTLYSSDSFPCVLPPVDFLPYDGHWFVVMPRWRDGVMIPEILTAGEILHFIHCLLKGLSFLHKNLIVHRDLQPGNMLINHFSQPTEWENNMMRMSMRRERLLTYAWFDFDLSIMFPATTPPEKRHLPWYKIGVGASYLPQDIAQGELDYNPFACDIASHGIWLGIQYQHLTVKIPMLAPVIDRTVDFNPKTRYTAPQVLQLFEGLYSSSVYPFQLT